MMIRLLSILTVTGTLGFSLALAADKPALTEAETAAIAQIRKSGGQVMERRLSSG